MKKKLLALMLVAATLLPTTGCASWDSTMKDWESDTKGLHRIVKVIALDGTVIAQYESEHMRLNYSDGSTITLDFDGQRIVISNAQVIVEEVK